MKRSNITKLILAILLGIVVGSYLGQLLGLILPDGAVKTFFTSSVEFGFDEFTISLGALKIKFGLLFRFNFTSLLALFVVLYYFKWWI